MIRCICRAKALLRLLLLLLLALHGSSKGERLRRHKMEIEKDARDHAAQARFYSRDHHDGSFYTSFLSLHFNSILLPSLKFCLTSFLSFHAQVWKLSQCSIQLHMSIPNLPRIYAYAQCLLPHYRGYGTHIWVSTNGIPGVWGISKMHTQREYQGVYHWWRCTYDIFLCSLYHVFHLTHLTYMHISHPIYDFNYIFADYVT